MSKMYTLYLTNKFTKDVKRLNKRGKDLGKLNAVIEILLSGQPLEHKFKDHYLMGNYSGFKECHIEPDWLLIYTVNDDKLVLTAARTGTHSDLF